MCVCVWGGGGGELILCILTLTWKLAISAVSLEIVAFLYIELFIELSSTFRMTFLQIDYRKGIFS